MCLSKYKLKSYQEFRDLMQIPGFYEFAKPVYDFLEVMEEGTIFNFATKCQDEQKLEWFIKVACLFIWCGHFEYEFNDDFTKIRRKRLMEIEKNGKKSITKGYGTANYVPTLRPGL